MLVWLAKKALELSLLMLGVILLLVGVLSSLFTLVAIITKVYLPGLVGGVLTICCLWGGWYLVISRPARLLYEERRKLGWYGAYQNAPATRMTLHNAGENVDGYHLRSEAEKIAAFKGITTIPVYRPQTTKVISWLVWVVIVAWIIFTCVSSIMLAERFFSPAFEKAGIVVTLVSEWILLFLVIWGLQHLKSRSSSRSAPMLKEATHAKLPEVHSENEGISGSHGEQHGDGHASNFHRDPEGQSGGGIGNS